MREIEEKIKEVCSPFPEYEFLLSIPGFGPDVAARVLGAIGDPLRFENGRQVLKLAGFDLSAKRSGKSSERVVPWSEKGKQISVCVVPGGFDCFDSESGLYGLLYPQAPGSRKRGRLSQNAGRVFR